MKVSERLEDQITKLKTLSDIKYVDLFFNQDESESFNIPDYPAALVNINQINPEENKTGKFQLNPNFGILVFFDGIETTKERELMCLDMIEDICTVVAKDNVHELISAQCIERNPRQTVWFIEYRYRG